MAAIAWTYPLVMLVAIATGGWLLRRSQRDSQLTNEQKIAVGLGAFCGAMIGAKLPFAIADLPGLLSGAVWFSNGKTIVYGMVGAYAGVEIAKWLSGVRIKTGDSFAVPVAVAVGIGRLGCFVAGCCYGVPTTLPWGMQFDGADGGHVLRHPTQIYESLFHFAMAALLVFLQRRELCARQLVKLYILSYLVFRWLTEFIRPEPQVWLELTGYQWFAIAAIPIYVFLWWRDAQLVQVQSHVVGEPSPGPILRSTGEKG